MATCKGNNTKNTARDGKNFIERPARKDEEFYVAGYACAIANNKETKKLIDGKYGIKNGPLSTELAEGVNIKANAGGEYENYLKENEIEVGE